MEQKKETKCIFCKLAHGELPTDAIYEDDYFKVVMDLKPITKGHCIILPKTHAENIYELPEEYCSRVLLVAQKCSKVLKKVLHCDGLNLLQNNGEIAGQTEFHFHMHLIPRYEDDNVTMKFGEPITIDIQSVAEEIRKGF